MQGKATLIGHPIHPMLIPFPIGFFVGALLSDIISHFSDNQLWPQMSVALIGFGVIAALLAAVFGFIDYYSAPLTPEAKRTGLTHMILNLIVVAVFAGAYFVRASNATAALGYILTVAGNLVLLVSGVLGGHLSYHHRVGVEES